MATLMAKPLLRLETYLLTFGVAVAFVSTAQGLERRPVLAFPEVQQPAAGPCATNCPARIDQPGSGSTASPAAGPGTSTGGGSSSGGGAPSTSGGVSSGVAGPGGSSSGGSSSSGSGPGGIGGGLGGIGGGLGGIGGGSAGGLGGATGSDLDAKGGKSKGKSES
jgi:hypothetical protein